MVVERDVVISIDSSRVAALVTVIVKVGAETKGPVGIESESTVREGGVGGADGVLDPRLAIVEIIKL